MRARDVERGAAGRRGGARRRARTIAPLFAGLSALAGGCDGDWWSDDPVEPPDMPTPALRQRYVLTSLNGTVLPFTISTGATRVRLIADTLRFAGAGTPPGVSGTYVEVRTIGTQQGAGAEVVTTTVSPARPWRRGPFYAQLLLEQFEGVAGPASVTMQIGNAQALDQPASIFGPLGSYTFTPR